jgi:hypothetical protein
MKAAVLLLTIMVDLGSNRRCLDILLSYLGILRARVSSSTRHKGLDCMDHTSIDGPEASSKKRIPGSEVAVGKGHGKS